MTSFIELEIHTEDLTPQKWCVSLAEEVFNRFLSQGNHTMHKVFGDGSLFSPMLFGKFFDPSDAFPLWEFESDVLLANLRSLGKTTVDWFQTDQDYVLRAELPVGKNNATVYVENGKIVEISGQWKQQREIKTKDWRTDHWWEYGYVRRLELPADADWREMVAHINNDIFLEIRIPKNSLRCDTTQGNGATS
ncbi:HSP20 domain-containing protein [Cephalotus follicularis]|uniref:HSP20 domain-containing protein n=1 Tax=Cephalotus follicularis TaxID=3775 RepID=A0A1Q3DER4_CEPFO|nr:HSP20 domain-containing protein [Cephalotus follicularis]